MAQDPCAFNFIYTNYSDEKALFANFRHLQEHLNRIGCGATTEEAEIILAASNSSAAAKERADVTCDGVDDEVEINDAFATIQDTGGRIIFQDGDYYLGDSIVCTPQQKAVVFQGAGRPVLHATSTITPSLDNLWMVRSNDNVNALLLSFDGLVFDGDDVAKSAFLVSTGTTVHPNIIIQNCEFTGFKSRILHLNYNGNKFFVFRNNWLHDIALTDDDASVGDKFGIQINDGLSIWHVWICDNFFDNVTLGAGTQGIVDVEGNAGVSFVTQNIVINCDTPVFRDLGSGNSVISNNWINGTYTVGTIAHDHGEHTGMSDNDHPQYLLHTVADAKGDIVAASAADVWDNLTVGSNQTVLVADSAETLGLRYALPGGKDSIYGWYDVDLADALTADQMTRSVGVVSVPMAYPGSLVAVVVRSNEARTAGTATFEVFKNGVATGLTAVLDGTNTQTKVTTQAFGTDTFVAGDLLDIRVTTSAWTPTTADVEAGLVVQYDS